MTDSPEDPDGEGSGAARRREERPRRGAKPPAPGGQRRGDRSDPPGGLPPRGTQRGRPAGSPTGADGRRTGRPGPPTSGRRQGGSSGADGRGTGRPAADSSRGRASGDSADRGDRGGARPPRRDGRPDARGQRDTPVDQPFRPRRKPAPRRPDLPEERPFLPREAFRDLKASVPPTALDDVVKAVAGAAEALEAGNLDTALELLAWAKNTAPRSPTVRESLGIALYSAQRFHEAHSELLAYRRLSAAHDQNHLLADCARALDRPEKVVEYVEEMMAAGVDPERVTEGLMVVAGDRADRGDLAGALETLQRADLDPPALQEWHPRLWYLAGDLCERLGRTEESRDYFEAVLAIDPEFGDVEERLAALD